MAQSCRPSSHDEENNEIDSDMFLAPLNDQGSMILKGYTIGPELLDAFKACCVPGHCTELAALIFNGLQSMAVISRMQEIANLEGSPQTWQKTQKGSFDNLISTVNRIECKRHRDGSISRHERYYTIDERVFVDGRAPCQAVWELMTRAADMIADHGGQGKASEKAEDSPRRSPVPSLEEWTQIRKRNLLYPTKDEMGEWVYLISEGADMEEIKPLMAKTARDRETSHQDNTLLDRDSVIPEMPGDPFWNHHGSRGRSPSTESPR